MIGIKVNTDSNYAYITLNYRHIIENGWLDDLKYLCEPTEFHEKRVTVQFTTSNGIMREFTRHRSHSFAVESTRYCNYSKSKFNNELTFIEPSWYETAPKEVKLMLYKTFKEAEDTYLNCLKGVCYKYKLKPSSENWEKPSPEDIKEVNFTPLTPQQAREVLPLATKCDMVMTGFISDWEHFFDLRTRGVTGAPHPDAKALAEPLMQEFIKRNYI